jgi:hypothetical protein
MKLFINFVLIIIYSLTTTGVALAESTSLSQSIVPLQCYIDAVNAGNGSHLTVKPEDCQNQVINPVTSKQNNDPNTVKIPEDKKLVIYLENNDRNSAIIPNEEKNNYNLNNTENTTKAFIVDTIKNDHLSTFFVISATLAISWTAYTYLITSKTGFRKK